MSVAQQMAVVGLIGILTGGALAGCGQKGPLVLPDAAPRHKKIAPLKVPGPPVKAPPAAPAPAAPADPQQ